jgi:hypothetical protein
VRSTLSPHFQSAKPHSDHARLFDSNYNLSRLLQMPFWVLLCSNPFWTFDFASSSPTRFTPLMFESDYSQVQELTSLLFRFDNIKQSSIL